VTESIEEQTPEARAQVAAAASALGASEITVLAGSPSLPHPGQRQICSVRTAGTPAAPRRYITTRGAYSRLAVMLSGEAVHSCLPNFMTGTPPRIGVRLSAPVWVRAMDRYGNTLSVVDSVELTSSDGGFTTTARKALTGGLASFGVTFSNYGTPAVLATGRRLRISRNVAVVPVSRTWTGAASAAWGTSGNWNVGSIPASQDTVVIPSGTPNQPALSSSLPIGGVTVANGATLTLGPYVLTASGDVSTGQITGGISATTGRLVLGGIGRRLAGRFQAPVQVTGTYVQIGDVRLRTPADVSTGGGLFNAGFMTDIGY
jgi:hypothetical protein